MPWQPAQRAGVALVFLELNGVPMGLLTLHLVVPLRFRLRICIQRSAKLVVLGFLDRVRVKAMRPLGDSSCVHAKHALASHRISLRGDASVHPGFKHQVHGSVFCSRRWRDTGLSENNASTAVVDFGAGLRSARLPIRLAEIINLREALVPCNLRQHLAVWCATPEKASDDGEVAGLYGAVQGGLPSAVHAVHGSVVVQEKIDHPHVSVSRSEVQGERPRSLRLANLRGRTLRFCLGKVAIRSINVSTPFEKELRQGDVAGCHRDVKSGDLLSRGAVNLSSAAVRGQVNRPAAPRQKSGSGGLGHLFLVRVFRCPVRGGGLHASHRSVDILAAPEQQAYHLLGSCPISALSVAVGTAVEKERDALCMAMRGCHVQRRLFAEIDRLNLGPVIGKQRYDLVVAMHRGNAEWSRTVHVLGLLLRTELEQEGNDLPPSSRASDMQGSLEANFQVRLLLGKIPDDADISRGACHPQRRVATDRGCRQGSTLPHQGLDFLRGSDRTLDVKLGET
eukprot:scaffold11_cov257-Pinguiococcus_pyrenoidosus.AAC.66